jgi:hypothetical protein
MQNEKSVNWTFPSATFLSPSANKLVTGKKKMNELPTEWRNEGGPTKGPKNMWKKKAQQSFEEYPKGPMKLWRRLKEKRPNGPMGLWTTTPITDDQKQITTATATTTTEVSDLKTSNRHWLRFPTNAKDTPAGEWEQPKTANLWQQYLTIINGR